MTIYHTATQEDYNSLMIELEKQGFRWRGEERKKLTDFDEFKTYGKDTYIYEEYGIISFSNGYYFKTYCSNEPLIEYKADKQGETDNFIKELTVKIYYNEITKKHYNSYEDAIADCKKEMEKLHDKN